MSSSHRSVNDSRAQAAVRVMRRAGASDVDSAVGFEYFVKDMPEPLNFDWAPAWFFAERSPALARAARPLNYELLKA
jgi:hypothetical protein